MTIQDAILKNFNRELSREALYRALLDHADWRGGGASGFVWIASTQNGADKIASSVREDLIGTVTAIPQLDDHLLALPPDTKLFKIDPVGPLSLVVDANELTRMRRFAAGYRTERAIAAGDYPRVLAFAQYLVPYYGVLGEGHQVLALPTEHGTMVPVFTTVDAIELFLETGDAESRARVRFQGARGDVLFGEIGPTFAKGVIVNIAGPRTFGFDLNACRLVVGA
jgi:hypothetical protein